MKSKKIVTKVVFESGEYAVFSFINSPDFQQYCEEFCIERFGEYFFNGYAQHEEFPVSALLKISALRVICRARTMFGAFSGWNLANEKQASEILDLSNSPAKGFLALEETWFYVEELENIELLQTSPNKKILTKEDVVL
ncbi:hypothetical protein [Vibrio vulnificus]|uniref:hypothetical protein n=1 Tax=Vibrio vulnificus TaxID=672 RepID=UPI001FAFE119|nr:hypothetical protein [Vibrio vulnificus]MCJ0803030.1 hypothetical protein [Vibrio vulnificus]